MMFKIKMIWRYLRLLSTVIKVLSFHFRFINCILQYTFAAIVINNVNLLYTINRYKHSYTFRRTSFTFTHLSYIVSGSADIFDQVFQFNRKILQRSENLVLIKDVWEELWITIKYFYFFMNRKFVDNFDTSLLGQVLKCSFSGLVFTERFPASCPVLMNAPRCSKVHFVLQCIITSNMYFKYV